MPEHPLGADNTTGQDGRQQWRPMVELGFLNPRSIRGKIIISLLALYFLGSLAAIAALFSTSRVESKIEVIESFYELNEKILETRRHEKNFLLYGNSSDLESALEYLDKVRVSINKPMGELLEADEQNSLAHAAELEEYGRILKQLSQPQLPPTKAALLKAKLRRLGHGLTQVVFEMDTTARQAVEKEARRYREMVLGILGTALLFGALLCIFLVRWIVQPLQAIRQATGRIMLGEMDTIPMGRAIRSSVEGVELVESLNKMLSALEAKQNQLIQSTKLAAIGKVTAGIAHEINNPLNNISLTAEVLLEDLPNLDCAERLEMVRDVLVQADRAREVVSHLLDFSRTRKPTASEKVNLLRLLSASMVLLKNQLRIGQIKTEAAFPEEPLLVMGNANQLQQVLVNIILNGIQAMSPGGLLRLEARADSDQHRAVVSISDTGSGIPVESQAQIFDPFFTTKNDGTGLGLSVSYAIIRDHRGDITLESNPEHGTTFRIILPLAGEEE
ncbi:MAG: ATP-binding protein [Desulfobulbaceae bacterium]|nr:ATP-binding protein [Desulfobulbaceae bacterium]